MVGMVAYIRRHQVEWPVARWAVYGGVPATVVGALLSRYVGGRPMLIASAVVLAAVGVRLLLPLPEGRLAGLARRRAGVVVPAAAAIGLFTGLLANGGGFLLVSLFVMVLGLTMPESAEPASSLSLPSRSQRWRRIGPSVTSTGPLLQLSPAAPFPEQQLGRASRSACPPNR